MERGGDTAFEMDPILVDFIQRMFSDVFGCFFDDFSDLVHPVF